MNFVEKNVWGGWYVRFFTTTPFLSQWGGWGRKLRGYRNHSLSSISSPTPPPAYVFGLLFFFRLVLSSIETKTTSFLLHGVLNLLLWTVGPHLSQIGCSLGFLYLGKQSLNLCCTFGWQHCLTLVCPQTIQKRPRTILRRKSMAGDSRRKGGGGVSRATRQLRTWTKAENSEY